MKVSVFTIQDTIRTYNNRLPLIFLILCLFGQSTIFLASNNTLSIEKNEAIIETETACACNPVSDSLALVALYHSTNGNNWTNKANWLNPGSPIGSWFGVYTNVEGCVEFLFPSDNALSGSIPSELGNLSNLTHLYLQNNSLSGTIPTELGNLSNLTDLYLENNSLSGNIPPELGNLTNLIRLYLHDNALSGSIPTELANLTNLPGLYLQNNFLSGTIPAALGNLSNLTEFNLSNNSLSGNIPPELGNLMSLTILRLFNNSLSGNIPTELENLNNLISLDLSSNSLSGNIPTELGNLTDLTTLQLSNNSLSNNIPTELGNLNRLIYLDLSSNSLSGNIPVELSNMNNLAVLLLENNSLSGTIPSELGNLSNLVHLGLSHNLLSGNIPVELGNLSNLFYLYLDNNSLSGSIPIELGNLNGLYYLFVNNNQLSGCFPQGLDQYCNIIYDFTGNAQLPGGGDFEAFCSTTAGLCPSCPATTITTNNIISGYLAKLNWNMLEAAERYRIRYREEGESWIIFLTANIEPYRFMNNLIPNTTYEAQVKTLCEDENSAWSASTFFTTSSDLCDSPSSTGVNNITTSGANPYWASYPDDIKYKIKYKAQNTGPWAIVTTNAPSYEITGLSSSTTYKYKLKTKCSGGWTNWSTNYNFVTGNGFSSSSRNSFEKEVAGNIKISPNPVTNQLLIELNDKKVERIYIRSVDGRTAKEILIQHSTIPVDVSGLHEGVYFLQILFSDGTFKNQKIIKC